MKTNPQTTIPQMSNPYQSPEFVEHGKLSFGIPRWVSWMTWLYPVLFLLSLYGTWLIAWCVLGHQPKPSIDDPKSIGWLVSISYTAAGIIMAGFPVAAIAGIIVQLFVAERSWPMKLLLALLLATCWFATIMILRSDPFDVVNWFMD